MKKTTLLMILPLTMKKMKRSMTQSASDSRCRHCYRR
jgi:hypothetical protein